MSFIPLRGIAWVVTVSAGLLAASAAAAESETNSPADGDPYAHETPAQRDARMQWWREARFGMFIHWGVYSVPAGTYNGKQIPGIGVWTNPDHWAEWEIEVTKPGRYDVSAEVSAIEGAGLEVAVGEIKASRNVAGTGDFERFRTARLGSLEISSPGKVTLSLRAVKENWNPLKVRSVRLRPAATL